MVTALDRNPATLKERSLSVFALGFEVEKFKKEIEIWRDLQIRLTKDSELLMLRTELGPISWGLIPK